MTTSRRLFGSSALVAVPLALTGCTWVQSLTTTAGSAAGQAAVARVVAYIQAGVTTLKNAVAIFGGQMSASAQGTVADALGALDAAAASVGNAITTAASSTVVATSAGTVISTMQIAVDAVLAGLSFIPGAGAAIIIAKEVAAFIPVISAFVSSILPPAATVPVPALSARSPAAAKHLGVMMP